MSKRKGKAVTTSPHPQRESLGLSPAVLSKRSPYIPEPWGPNIHPLMVHYDPWCQPFKPRIIRCKDVVKAHQVIKKVLPTTPLTRANGCNTFGMNLYFKRETVHKTGSFHERSAIYVINKLTEEQRKHGLYTASLGNWAMALSYYAQKENIPVTVHLPSVSETKYIELCKDYGATVHKFPFPLNKLRELSIDLMKETTGVNDCYISGYDHPDVIAGAGTIALEILEQLPNVDAILVSIGGGGLLAGVATVVKKLKPDTLVYGMEPYKLCSFYKSMKAGKPSLLKDEFQLIPTVGYNSFNTARSLVDKVILVNEECMSRSILYYAEEERFIVERRSGNALALLFMEPNPVPELRDKNVVCIISGGNISSHYPQILEHAKSVEGRMLALKIKLPVGRTDLLAKFLNNLRHLRCTLDNFDMEHRWIEVNDMEYYYATVQCETGGMLHASTVIRVLQKLYPNQIEFLQDTSTYFKLHTCPCYPPLVKLSL